MEIILNEILGEIQDLKTTVHGELQSLRGDVQALQGDMQILKGDVQALQGDMQILKGDVASLKEDVKILKEDVRFLKAEQVIMKGDLQILKEEQQTMKAMLSSHGDHIHQLLQIVAATNAYTEELKEDMVEVKTVQIDHERILEHLSLRSLTHEVNIADLARIRQA